MTSVARWTGLAAGVSLALVALVFARVPSGTREVPAHVSLLAEPSVKLGVSPVARELLTESTLLPGSRSVSGLVEVSNLTGAPLEARPRLRALGGDAPDALQVEVTAGGKTLYSGKLGELRAHVRLGARAAKRIRFRISAPLGAARELSGRSAKLSLRWATRREGR
jgi:hypothetical protein